MKRIKWGQRISQLWIFLFIVENFYFGWNKVAMSSFEADCDTALIILLYVAIFTYLSPLLDLYERAVLKNYVDDTIRISASKPSEEEVKEALRSQVNDYMKKNKEAADE